MEAFEFLLWWIPDVFSEIVAHDTPWWVQILAVLGCLGVMLAIGAVMFWAVLRWI